MWKSGRICDQCVPGSPPPAHREPGDEAMQILMYTHLRLLLALGVWQELLEEAGRHHTPVFQRLG